MTNGTAFFCRTVCLLFVLLTGSDLLSAQDTTADQVTSDEPEAELAIGTGSDVAAAPETEDTVETDTASDRAQQAALLEEITVRGEQNFISIRGQIERAEDNLYSLFNELNSRDDFDIVCRTVRLTNTRIPRRSCEPVFFTEMRRTASQFAQSELRQAWSENGIDVAMLDRAMDFVPEDGELQELAASTFEELQEEMLRIATENPRYLEALMQVDELKALLLRERERRFGSSGQD